MPGEHVLQVLIGHQLTGLEEYFITALGAQDKELRPGWKLE